MMIVCIKQKRYTQNIVLIICAFACLHGVTAQGTGNKARFNINAGVSQGICISTAKYSTSNTIQGPHKDASKLQASVKAKCEIIQRNKCGNSDGSRRCRTFECPRSPEKGTRIVGGTDAVPNEFPYLIQVKKYGEHHCGGSLLNERYVISAAGCFGKHPDLSHYSVLAGVHNQNKPSGTEQERKLKKITVHEGYDRPTFSGNDLVLIEVDPPFDLTAAVQPVLMPQPNYEATGEATVTGWGSDDPARLDTPILQKLTVPIITNKECSDKWSVIKKILPTELCAGFLGSEGIGACLKDIGGPLLVKMANGSYVFVGIVAWDIGCPEAHFPGIYTRVSKFVDWIYKNAGVNISQVTPPISEC